MSNFKFTPATGGHEVTALDITTPITSTVVSRRLEDRLSEVVSVKDFGVTGDGTTDDTTNISNAVTYIESLSSGGILYFPPGDYMVSSNILISGNNVTLCGAGRSSRIFTKAETDITTLGLRGSYFEMYGLFFDGAYDTSVSPEYNPGTVRSFLLMETNSVANVEGVFIHDCWFEDHPGRPIYGAGDPANGYTIDYVTIKNCYFFNCPRTGVLLFKGCNNWVIEGCFFRQVGSCVIADDATASDSSPPTTAANHNVTVTGCVFKDCGGAGLNVGAGEGIGINCSGAVRWTVTGCTFDTAGQFGGETAQYHVLFNDGQEFYRKSTDITITGNTFTQGTNPSIVMVAVDRAAISGNVFHDNYIRASDPGGSKGEIHLDNNTNTPTVGCDHISITGNTFTTDDASSRTNTAVYVLDADTTNVECTGNTYGRDANGVFEVQPFEIATYTSTDNVSRNLNLRDHSHAQRLVIADDEVNDEVILSEYANVWIDVWTDQNTEYGQAYARLSGGGGVTIVKAGGTSTFAVTTNAGKPADASGTDTDLTLYADTTNTGQLWFSNRLGTSVEVFIAIRGAN